MTAAQPSRTKKIVLIAGAIGVVALLAASFFFKPGSAPPRPAVEAGRDAAALYAIDTPPVPRSAAPGRLVAGETAIAIEAMQGRDRTSRQVLFFNRGETTVTVEGIELSGDPDFSVTSSCSELQPGASCEVRIAVPHAAAGRFRGALELRWRAAGLSGIETARVAVSAAIAALPEIAAPPPFDETAWRLSEMRRARAQAPSGLIAGREAGEAEIVERADGAYVRRRPAIADDTPASTQENYGGYPRRTSTFPVDRTRVITADRVIPATLQTSINSRIPGEVRAIVSENVMGADGRLVLIPARTALLGRYEGAMPGGGTATGGARGLRVGDVRLAIRWVRMIRPDGAHVIIDDAGYDAMGRAGLIGEVDNRIFERFFGAALVSTMSVGGAIAQGYLSTSDVGYQSVIQNGTTVLVPRLPSPGERAMSDGMRQAIDRMSNFAEQMLREGMNLEPIITIPQGTQFFVVPRDDLWFPAPKQASGTRGGVLETRIVRRPEAPGMRLFGGDQEDRMSGGDSAN